MKLTYKVDQCFVKMCLPHLRKSGAVQFTDVFVVKQSFPLHFGDSFVVKSIQPAGSSLPSAQSSA